MSLNRGPGFETLTAQSANPSSQMILVGVMPAYPQN
jgi:hypothetical protein